MRSARCLSGILNSRFLGCGRVSCCTRRFLAMCFMEFTGQRQCCLCMPNSGAGPLTSVHCGQSCSPLVYLLLVSVQLLLFAYILLSFLLVECSDGIFFEVCAIIDSSSWKDVRELASGSVVELLSGYCRNDFKRMRLPCITQRRFFLQESLYDRFGECVDLYNGDMQVHA